jgi:hypothetical protein
MKLILGLMWTLILHYSITLPAWEIPNEKKETTRNVKPKQKLMNWLQAKVSTQINIANFTSDWNDGRAIGAVLESCYPGNIVNNRNYLLENIHQVCFRIGLTEIRKMHWKMPKKQWI